MKLGLGLIVRNEEIDLPACLESFLPCIDAVAIVDTGSTDNTVSVAIKALKDYGIPYKIVTFTDCNDSQGRINNFSLARNEYIRILEAMDVDYIMSADADDILITNHIKDIIEQEGMGDFFSINYRMDSGASFHSYKIWKADTKSRYVGRVHECLGVDWSKTVKHLPIIVQHHYANHESQEYGSERNLRILKEEIYPPLRSLFYYANENVDIKNYNEAIKWYLEYIRRANEGETCWPVELAHCYFRAARWLQAIGRTDDAIRLSRELLAKDSTWSESWCELAYIYTIKRDYEEAEKCCLEAMKNQFRQRLFSEPDKYSISPSNMLIQIRQIKQAVEVLKSREKNND
jgi:glycosyltransferase involved in cell wall biosynthesis